MLPLQLRRWPVVLVLLLLWLQVLLRVWRRLLVVVLLLAVAAAATTGAAPARASALRGPCASHADDADNEEEDDEDEAAAALVVFALPAPPLSSSVKDALWKSFLPSSGSDNDCEPSSASAGWCCACAARWIPCKTSLVSHRLSPVAVLCR